MILGAHEDLPPTAAVVLAAGAGKRMGNRPKALLRLGAATFLERGIAICSESGCRPVVVVTRPDTPAIEDLARAAEALPVENPDPGRGMFSSVQLGVQAALEAAPGVAAVLIHPVDHPRVKASTLLALRRRFAREPGAKWVRPTWQGRGGHPLLLDAGTARALLERAPTEPLRDALAALGRSPVSVPVDDPGILANLNTPGDLE